MAGGKWPPLVDEAPELGRQRLVDPNPIMPPIPTFVWNGNCHANDFPVQFDASLKVDGTPH